jgi:hypothetical protein
MTILAEAFVHLECAPHIVLVVLFVL